MKTIIVKINDYEESVSFMADTHPVVNDKDYCEIVKSPSTLSYEYDGIKCGVSEYDATKEELKKEAEKNICFDIWFEENWMKNFWDFNMESPKIYDPEEDTTSSVDSIDDYVNNCKFLDDNYEKVIGELTSIACESYVVKWEEGE